MEMLGTLLALRDISLLRNDEVAFGVKRGARWGEPEAQAERRREIERLQAQLADFYQQATENQEARQSSLSSSV